MSADADAPALTAADILAAPITTDLTTGSDAPPMNAGVRQLDILARQLLAIQGQLDAAFAVVAGLQDRERVREAAATLEHAPPDLERRPPPTFGAKRRAEAQNSTPTGSTNAK